MYFGKLLEEVDGISITPIFAGGRRITSKSGAEIFYYHPDHLGSLNVATDADGAEVQRVTYYPFGEIRTNAGNDPGNIDLAYKFTGQEYDSETGLYYYGARYYDPAIGRFITPDSIVQAPGDPRTLNRCAYARNNPLLYVDPTGHFFEAFLAFIGMLAGGAAPGGGRRGPQRAGPRARSGLRRDFRLGVHGGSLHNRDGRHHWSD
ncbi:MAG: RHS repeat-associated core domain-containing protein [Syntrophobacteraceae bacterium]